jgi:hypothetical protein
LPSNAFRLVTSAATAFARISESTLPFNPAGLLCFTVAGPDSLFPVTAAVEYHVIRAAVVKQINSSF